MNSTNYLSHVLECIAGSLGREERNEIMFIQIQHTTGVNGS